MSRTSRGKIGRLPTGIREEVNRRMENGEKGAVLAAWLNSLPEVRAVLAAEFNGQPVAECNLSRWRKHGHRDWVRWREAMAMAERETIPVEGGEPLMDQMTKWASVYYLMTVRELNRTKGEGAAGPEFKLKMLREFCRDAVALQRGESRSGRLKLEEARLALSASKAMVQLPLRQNRG